MGAVRKGYTNKMEPELGHADGEGHSSWKEQNEHSHGHREQMATVVLTGNPGGPGTPSGPCDTRKTKQWFRSNISRSSRSPALLGSTPPCTFQRLEHVPAQWGSQPIWQKRILRPRRGPNGQSHTAGQWQSQELHTDTLGPRTQSQDYLHGKWTLSL